MGERAGKDLLLKYAQGLEVDVAIASPAVASNILAVAHGKKVGDIVKFETVPGSVSEVVANTPYYIVSVLADSFKIALSPNGTAIVFTDVITDLPITVFSTIGGLRTHSMSFGSDAIDGTNYGSDQWRKIIDEAGIRSMSLSGDGVYTDAENFELLQDDALANRNVQLAWVDVKAGVTFFGEFKLTSFECAGAYDGEGTYSLSGESSGPVLPVRAA